MWYAILKWHSKIAIPIPYQDILDETKDRVEEIMGLHPINKRLLKGVKTLRVPHHPKDHMRCLVISRIKCGSFWNNNDSHTQNAY